MSETSVLKADNVYKCFGSTIALREVSLDLDEGLHLLLGPNGSGKTTMLKLWAGLIKPTKGKVSVKGFDPWRYRDKIMSFMGVEFEDLAIPWWISGVEYLRFIASVKGVKWDMVKELAELFQVTGYWSKSIRSYSSGMRKKIILLAALIGENDILLLDEPYTLLDKRSINVLNKVILDRLNSLDAFVVASHVFTGIEDYASSLTILFNGNLIYHGKTVEILEKYEKNIICKTKDPMSLIEKLYSEGVKHIVLNGDKVIFKSENIPGWIKYYNCEVKVDIKDIYERKLAEI